LTQDEQFVFNPLRSDQSGVSNLEETSAAMGLAEMLGSVRGLLRGEREYVNLSLIRGGSDTGWLFAHSLPSSGWTLLSEVDDQAISAQARQIQGFGVGAVAVIMALLILGALVMTEYVAAPMRRMVASANRVVSGEIPPVEPEPPMRRDEIGLLSRSFARVIDFYRDIERVSVAVAAGDFTPRLVPRSDADRLSTAINDMAAKRQAAEAEMRRLTSVLAGENARIEAIIDAVPIPLFYKGPDTRYLGINKAFEESFGVRPARTSSASAWSRRVSCPSRTAWPIRKAMRKLREQSVRCAKKH